MISNKSDVNKVAVPAVERALNIFEILGEQGVPMTLKEISSALGIPSVSTFRIVKYLCSRGYIKEESDNSGQYSLGFQFSSIAHQLTKNSDLNSVAVFSMRKLAEAVGQTAQLAILHEYGVMYIEQIMPIKPVNIIAQLRTSLPVNISASGKVLVAHLQPEQRMDFINKAEFVNRTKRSITDKNEFEKELERVRENGFAIDNEEYARGIACLAAPIFDFTGQNIAAIGITGHIADYQNETTYEILKQKILEAAKEISFNLGFTD